VFEGAGQGVVPRLVYKVWVGGENQRRKAAACDHAAAQVVFARLMRLESRTATIRDQFAKWLQMTQNLTPAEWVALGNRSTMSMTMGAQRFQAVVRRKFGPEWNE
jgi:hypothetical protein